MHLDVNWQYVVKGVIILVAVYADMMRQRKSQARKEKFVEKGEAPLLKNSDMDIKKGWSRKAPTFFGGF